MHRVRGTSRGPTHPRAHVNLYTRAICCHIQRHHSMKACRLILCCTLTPLLLSTSLADEKPPKVSERYFRLNDLFDLEIASDPQISPDGTKVVFVRSFSDVMKDRKRSNLWIVDYQGSDLRPLTADNANDFSPRWSPDGKRLL